MQPIDFATKKLIKNKYPDLVQLLNDNYESGSWESWVFGPFEGPLTNEEADQQLADRPLVLEKASLINKFYDDILNTVQCYWIGHIDEFGATQILDSDEEDIYEQIKTLSSLERKNVKYHMPNFGRPRHNILMPELECLCCESFELLNVAYLKKDNQKNGILREYITKHGMNIW